jgi:hypothetical protein
MPECHKLVFAGNAELTCVKITNFSQDMVADMPGCHHSIAAIIAVTAENEHTARVEGKYLTGKTVTCTFHQLEPGHSQRYRVCIHNTHPGRGYHPRLLEFTELVRLHT